MEQRSYLWENNIQRASIKIMKPGKMKLEDEAKPEGNTARNYKRDGRSQLK